MALVGLAVGAGSQPVWSAPEPKTLTGRAVVLESPVPTQLARTARPHPLGETLRLGTAGFAVVRKGAATFVATAPGGAATTSVGAGKSAVFTWKDGETPRKRRVGFVAQEEGGLAWFAADAWRFRLGDTLLTLLDADGDARYGSAAHDAWFLGEHGFALPHVPRAVIENEEVTFEDIAEDGTRLRVRSAPVEGTAPQLAALAVLNRLRLDTGLLPCTLDGTSSRACTLHARYLRANAWTGFTNPHEEDPKAPGYTVEGNAAAQRSNISRHPPAAGIRVSWLTWYHRLPFLEPLAAGVGIADADELTVFDLTAAPAGGRDDAPAWQTPVLSPPDEPVPDAGRRGFPLLLVGPQASRIALTAFTLENVGGKKPVDVPATIGDPRHFPHAAGVVPDLPLERASRYRATFTWTLDGKPGTARIAFETEK